MSTITINGVTYTGNNIKVIQNSHKNKHHDDYNINPFRYGATARIGYKGLNLFGRAYPLVGNLFIRIFSGIKKEQYL